MAKYLMCGLAFFDDEYYELTSVNTPETVIHLGAAASRCLLVLLAAEGGVVTKKDLLQEGWWRYGNIVSGNNVNQAVAQIRKCFVLLGIREDSIVTIPRIGYKISDVFFSVAVGATKVGAMVPLDTTLPVDAPVASGIDQPAQSASHEIVPSALIPSLPISSVPTRKRLNHGYLVFLVLLLISTVEAYIVIPQLRGNLIQTASPVSYVLAVTKGETRYYAEQGFANKAEFIARRISVLATHPPRLLPGERNLWIYINGALLDGVFSYFLCSKEIVLKDAGCVSYVILIEERS